MDCLVKTEFISASAVTPEPSDVNTSGKQGKHNKRSTETTKINLIGYINLYLALYP